jgi:hypothetical protein
MIKPFKIVCSEMDQEFNIVDHLGLQVAPAPTAAAHSKAKWENKKISPKDLWESVSTPREREAILAVLDEPGISKDAVKTKLAALQLEFSAAGKTRKHSADDGLSR